MKRKHGTGSYQNKNGRHIIQFSQDGKRRTLSFETAVKAYQALEDYQKGKLFIKNTKDSKTIDVLFKEWITQHSNEPYYYGIRVRFVKHWLPIIGNLKPNQLNVDIIKSSIPILKEKGLSGSSVLLLLRILSTFIADLVENRYLDVNIVSQLTSKTKKKLIKVKDPAKISFLKKKEDIERIFTWLNGRNQSVSIAFALGVLAGMRKNEIRGLRWEDIDFNNKLIHVRWQAGTAKNELNQFTAPKNKMSRDIPMSDDLYLLLQKWFEKASYSSELVCRPPFTEDKNKKFLGIQTMYQLLKRACRVLHIPVGKWYNYTRHTFGSHYILNGGSLLMLKEIMGHSSYQTTEKHYVHLAPKFTDRDRNIIQVELKNHEKPIDFRLKMEYASHLDLRDEEIKPMDIQ